MDDVRQKIRFDLGPLGLERWIGLDCSSSIVVGGRVKPADA